jgi:hypothetical protein
MMFLNKEKGDTAAYVAELDARQAVRDAQYEAMLRAKQLVSSAAQKPDDGITKIPEDFESGLDAMLKRDGVWPDNTEMLYQAFKKRLLTELSQKKRNRSMKLTMNQLMQMQVSLVALSQIKLPAKVAYRVGRDLDKVGSHGKQAIGDMQKLYRETGVISEDGTQYLPPTDPEAAAVFQAAWSEIQNREVEIEFLTISLAELGDAVIEPAHLMALEGVIVVDDDAAPALRLVPAPAANE